MSRATDALLRTRGTDLETFLIEQRAQGMSAGRIAAALRDLTEGTIDVTRQTIYNWLAEIERHSELVPISEIIDSMLDDGPAA